MLNRTYEEKKSGLASRLRMVGLHVSTGIGMTLNRPWCNRNKKIKATILYNVQPFKAYWSRDAPTV